MIPGIELLAVYVYNPWIFLYRSLFVAHRSFFADYSRLYRAFERLITCDIYIYIHKRKKKEYNKKTENGMRYVFFNLCYFFLFEIILFYPMYNNFLCHLYFYDHWIIYFFISPFFFYLSFIRLISNQLNNLFFFF